MRKHSIIGFIVLCVCLYFFVPKTQITETSVSANMMGDISLQAEFSAASKTQKSSQNLPPQKEAGTTPTEATVEPSLTEDNLRELRSMAKHQLALSYSAFKAFHAQYHRYTTDLKAAGWRPTVSDMGYRMGFVQPFYPSEGLVRDEEFHEEPRDLENDILLHEKDETGEKTYSLTSRAEKLHLKDYAHLCEKDCSATQNSFEILLVLPLNDSGKADVWTINEKKELKLVIDGTKSE